MSWEFRRPYRLLQRIFPQSGLDDQAYPTRVTEVVTPTWDSAKPWPGDVIFNSIALVGNANAATFFLGSAVNQPSAGYVRLIYGGAILHADGTNVRNVSIVITQDTNTPADAWGGIFTIAGGSRVLGGVEVTGGRWQTMPRFPPVFRGSFPQFQFLGMTGGGEQVQAHYAFVDIPGELLTVENWR